MNSKSVNYVYFLLIAIILITECFIWGADPKNPLPSYIYPLLPTISSLTYSLGCVSVGMATWVRTAPGSARRDGGVLSAVISASVPEVRSRVMPPLALVTRTAQRDSQVPSVTCVSSFMYLFPLVNF